MKLKEDHMKNDQLKPAYNVQISTSNQIIVNYTIHPNTNDTNTLASHLEQHEKSFGADPKSLTADTGYGSEENYTLLEEKKVAAFVKYGLFDKRQNNCQAKKRCFDVEPVFGNIKHNHGFRRFMLLDKQKVEIEWRLIVMAQNIRKGRSRRVCLLGFQ